MTMLKKLRQLPLHTHFTIRTGLVIVGLPVLVIARSAGRGSVNEACGSV